MTRSRASRARATRSRVASFKASFSFTRDPAKPLLREPRILSYRFGRDFESLGHISRLVSTIQPRPTRALRKARSRDRWLISDQNVVGRGGLEPPTSALTGLERCAQPPSDLSSAERRSRFYVVSGLKEQRGFPSRGHVSSPMKRAANPGPRTPSALSAGCGRRDRRRSATAS